jgi:pimeloyl-ACP methyl ester carboxylesterase
MRQAPRRVTRLALLATSPEADTRERALIRGTLIEVARRQRFESVLRGVVPGMLGRTAATQTSLQQEVETTAREVGADAFRRQQSASLQRPDSRPELASYLVPCLILCGAEDTLTPPELHRNMAAQIPGAELCIVEGCGHLAPLEQAAAVNAALRSWLQYPR